MAFSFPGFTQSRSRRAAVLQYSTASAATGCHIQQSDHKNHIEVERDIRSLRSRYCTAEATFAPNLRLIWNLGLDQLGQQG